MSIQYKAAKHQSVLLAVKQTDLGMERVKTETSERTRKELELAAQLLTDHGSAVEAAILRRSDAGATDDACQKRLKYAIDTAVAFGRAEKNESLTVFATQRVGANDMAVAERMQDQLAEVKGPLADALRKYITSALGAYQEADAAYDKADEALSKADGLWATDCIKVAGLISLGSSIQAVAGFEVMPPKKKKAQKAKTVEADPTPAATPVPETPKAA